MDLEREEVLGVFCKGKFELEWNREMYWCGRNSICAGDREKETIIGKA